MINVQRFKQLLIQHLDSLGHHNYIRLKGKLSPVEIKNYRLINNIETSGNKIEFDATFPDSWCSGVTDRKSIFDLSRFGIDTQTINIEHMCFLLGYKKIVWCQNCNTTLIGQLKEFIEMYDRFHNKYPNAFTDMDIKEFLRNLMGRDNTELDKYKQIMHEFNGKISMKERGTDVFFYYNEFEQTVDKLIEIVEIGEKSSVRNEAAIGLLLGYSSKNVKEWIDRYETKNQMWGEILDISPEDVDDDKINNFLKKIDNSDTIDNGILENIEIPTTTKYKLFSVDQLGGKPKYKNKYLKYKYKCLQYKINMG